MQLEFAHVGMTTCACYEDLLNDFYATAATIIQAELAKEGYRLLLSVSGNDPQCEAAYLSAMQEERVQGLILVPCSRNEQALSEYAAEGVPVIEFARRSSTSLDAILPDDTGGAQAATEHLLRLGHTRNRDHHRPEDPQHYPGYASKATNER